jgi:ethanolamine utilization cobalamin adenosyltransferase
VIVTEASLREQLRPPRMHAQVTVPRGATLSPSAQDLVAHWQLEVREAEPVPAGGAHTSWDRPGDFPVVLDGEMPRCTTCGSEVRDKPDQLTQLDTCHFAPKTAPRIRLRGRIDSLHALTLLAASRAAADGRERLASDLGSVAAYCRELMSAEYNERPAASPELFDKDATALRDAGHDPQGAFGIGHAIPDPLSPELLHWLNLIRCQTREVEIVGIDAFPSPHHPYGASIVHGLNRLSSAVYYLELAFLAEGADR